MGKTSKEFIKMVETGKLVAADFLPKFARELRKVVRENGSLVEGMQKLEAQQQRLGTSFKKMVDDMFQGGASKSIGNFFNRISKLIDKVSPGVSSIGIALFEVFRIGVEIVSTIGELVNGISSLLGVSDLFGSIWGGIKIGFASLAAVVWDVIGAVQFLASIMTGENTLDDLGNNIKDFAVSIVDDLRGSLQQSSNVAAATSSSSTTTNINFGGVSVSANNSDDFMNSMINEMGM